MLGAKQTVKISVCTLLWTARGCRSFGSLIFAHNFYRLQPSYRSLTMSTGTRRSLRLQAYNVPSVSSDGSSDAKVKSERNVDSIVQTTTSVLIEASANDILVVTSSATNTTATVVTPDSTKKSPRPKRKSALKAEHKDSGKSKESPKKQRKINEAPKDWQDVFELVEELRKDRTAPCDYMGSEALPNRQGSEVDFRFQSLVSLILSSQTKDATVGAAIKHMQSDNVLNVQAIADMDAAKLTSYISKVGFHNNKTKFLKQVADILIRDYNGDIPPTAAEMMQLPGVGPKMAYICESVAWNKQSGIGIDTHMHRLFNALGWMNTKTAEQTRIHLQDWLPQSYWGTVNLLFVGFGQEVQQFKPKILRKALDCSRPADALRLLKRCGLDYSKEGKKLDMMDEINKVLSGCEDGNVSLPTIEAQLPLATIVDNEG